ncbi:2211_t:CDS:2 [Entrophospora sp. SA101]|nr:2211_t:CDS:2 [Entrophospora sp. SA101]
MSQGTSRRNRDNYWEEVKGTDPGYRSRSVELCTGPEEHIGDLEDELGNLESLLLIEDQKEDESEDESEAGGEIISVF